MKKLRDGREVYRDEKEIQDEVDKYSDEELARQVRRFYSALDSKMPIAGIVKDTNKASTGYVRNGG